MSTFYDDGTDEAETTTSGPAPEREKMDETDLQSKVEGIIHDCVDFIDSELSPARAKATDYYLGNPFGNEDEGRSQVVLTEVRDSVQGVLPPLLRVFFGPERPVEFVPRNAQQIQQAEQATDWINYHIETQDGFLKAHSVFKDGLVRKLGVFKYWWDDATTKTAYELEGVTQSQLELLGQDPEVEINRVKQKTKPSKIKHALSLVGGPPPEEATFNVELTRTVRDGTPCFEPLPPEEFIFSREGRGMDSATCVAHRTHRTRSELVAMGISEKFLSEYADENSTSRQNEEEIARRQVIDSAADSDVEAGEANDKIEYVEAYVKIDFDGDGIAELRKICTVGPGYEIAEDKDGNKLNTPVDSRPFAIFCPDPEPHTMLGQSWADRTMDLQLIKSSVFRAALDSLAGSIFPRIGFVEGQVNVTDILNTEIGAPIRMRTAGAIQPIEIPFVGEKAFPIISYLDDVAERRTGQSKGAQGLDMSALQSTEKAAAHAAVTAAQMQTEMLARIFAEQCWKPLMRGLLQLMVEHQPKTRMTRLRGQWVEVDPRAWDASMDLQVNVALGSGLTEEKIASLTEIAAKQEAILQSLGPANPVVSLAQYRETLARIIKLRGFKDVESFLKPVDPNWQPPAQQPPPSPEMMVAQAQIQIAHEKNQRSLAIAEAKLQLERAKAANDSQLAVKKLADDFTLRRYQIDAQFKAGYTESQMEADARQQELWLQGQSQAHDQALSVQQQGHDQAVAAHGAALAQDQQAHDQQMAEQAAAQQAAQGSTE